MFEIKRVVKKGDYLYAVCPEHPNRTKNNYVLLHRVLAENELGRILSRNEIVHHVDHDKMNNDPSNLQVMTASEHAKLHSAGKVRAVIDVVCPHCGIEFRRYANQVSNRKNIFCSRSCNASYSRKSGKWSGSSGRKLTVNH